MSAPVFVRLWQKEDDWVSRSKGGKDAHTAQEGGARSGGLPPLLRRVNRGVNNGTREKGKEESSLQQPQPKHNNKHLRKKYVTETISSETIFYRLKGETVKIPIVTIWHHRNWNSKLQYLSSKMSTCTLQYQNHSCGLLTFGARRVCI